MLKKSVSTSGLTQIPSPELFSESVHAFSALVDLKNYDPERTPKELGILLPKSLRRAVITRQAEFIAGRFAAREALRAAGCAAIGEIPMNQDRSPRWPEGFVGSITHSHGYVSAVTARSENISALGRDTEQLLTEKVALEIRKTVLRPDELKLQAVSGFGIAEYVGLIFSAKESLYKALYPIVREPFDFLDAEATEISKEHGRIRLRLIKKLGSRFSSGFGLEARFEIDNRVHTAVEITDSLRGRKSGAADDHDIHFPQLFFSRRLAPLEPKRAAITSGQTEPAMLSMLAKAQLLLATN